MYKTKICTFLATLIALPALASAHVGDDYFNHHDMMGQWGGHMWGGSLNSILVSIVLTLIIVLLFLLIQKQLRKR